MKLFIIKLKEAIISLLIYVFTVFLVFYSSANLDAAKNGMLLWATSIVPSLFSFFVATELLSYTHIIGFLDNILGTLHSLSISTK